MCFGNDVHETSRNDPGPFSPYRDWCDGHVPGPKPRSLFKAFFRRTLIGLCLINNVKLQKPQVVEGITSLKGGGWEAHLAGWEPCDQHP